MAKVFISQPMNGKTDQEILTEREQAFAIIKNHHPGYELIDTFIGEELSEKHTGLKYLAKSIEMLDDAVGVWFLKEWEGARGCRIEHECAKAYGIPIYYLT